MGAPLILAAPPSPPPGAGGAWGATSMLWIGPDGSAWDLTDWRSGVFVMRDGIEGLHFPKITKFSSQSRAFPGRRLRGWQAQARQVFWKVFVWADGTQEWIDRADAFFSTIRPDQSGTWRIAAGSQARTLELTGVFDDSYSYEVDPLQHGWAVYPVAMEAVDPYWRGQIVRRGPWRAPEPAPFIPEGGGPPFTISSRRTFATATIPNPGDVDAWALWRVVGPLESIELGVAGAVIDVPFSVAPGAVLEIDTDPRRPSAKLNGVDATADLGLQDYAAVPPGAQVQLHIAATGAGQVAAQLQPLHFRAF